MRPDTRMEDARRRMELRPPVRLEYEGQLNDDPNQRSEYPRMLYRQTDVEQVEMIPGAEGFDDLKVKDKQRVINRFDGLLCETCIAQTPTEAEALAELGWDVSPRAAYGAVEGLVSATSAKDARIAELEALVAAQEVEQQGGVPEGFERVKRGPGRPPKAPVADEN